MTNLDRFMISISYKNSDKRRMLLEVLPCGLNTADVARAYDVLINESMSLRATFIIDPKGYFRYQAIHDLSIGRNIDEIIRVLEGLQTYQKTGKLLPAGWSQGKETLTPTQEHLSDYMVRNSANL